MKGITLLSGVEKHRDHPDTFEIPDETHKLVVCAGDYVKLMFRDEAGTVERMWVEVTADCVGKLANHPEKLKGVAYGEPIQFKPEHIINIIYQEHKEKHGL